MTFTEKLSRTESRLRPAVSKLPPSVTAAVYSYGRKFFLNRLINDKPGINFTAPQEFNLKLWELNFGNCLFNAAGMFKSGKGYEIVYAQGAGAFLAGTTTAMPREGNIKKHILHPFMPLPRSGAALNWMGLPNAGHAETARLLSKVGHKKLCPIGASISADPIDNFDAKMIGVIEGLELYNKAAVCFIELNESCPNVPHGSSAKNSSGLDENLVKRLSYISEKFLKKRQNNYPVTVKFSNDTNPEQIPALIDLLTDLEFDGINLGNTSVKYEIHKNDIDSKELKPYRYFIDNFGGGISGAPLKDISLELAAVAAHYLSTISAGREFHVIRTGGIDSPEDLQISRKAGISLNQWFTGYFENFARHGHRLYEVILS
ncbi:MAG: hypothetical protein ACLFQU_03275 [Candidatus Kapaibacterium sp.]